MELHDLNDTTELCHYGVLGMRWGVRKDRKKGVKKKAKVTFESPFKPKPKTQNQPKRISSDDDDPSKKKPISSMTDDELRAAINRIQMERQYAQLIAQPPSKGKAFVKKFVAENAQSIAKSYVQKYANRKIDQILDKKFGKEKKSDDSGSDKKKKS